MIEHSFSGLTVHYAGEKSKLEISGKTAVVETANLDSADGLKAEISIQDFQNGEIHVRLTEFLTDFHLCTVT